ncbi:MAG: hypothetical protein EPO08_00575 [Rhodospirillaceae bacterium]|nr:MAG: hypothetical protein EPO08_00575 [Rhodospirillaceae bacterium]
MTAILVAGYVTLYFAMASQGKMRTFGKILAGWAFLLAALLAIAAVACPAFGVRPYGMMSMHERWHEMMDRDGRQGPPPGMMPGAQTPDGPPAPPPAAAPQN